jgi:arginyl-tRNA--protein-N-Asp/Glu arginylyltransferase
MDAAAPQPPPLPPPWPVRLTVLPPHPCPYLPGRTATIRAFATDRLDGAAYHGFMDAGFRRSGRMVYQPVCDGCRLCVPIRLAVDRFAPDKSQRRCARRNADLTVTVDRPTATDEKFALYRRYVTQWHDKPAGNEDDANPRGAFESFLYGSPVSTLEFCYRDPAGQLLAVGIADVCDRSFSSVYFYFDPDHRDRGLGTFGAIHEIAWAGRQGIPHYYLGYWVSDCRKMAYKTHFRPYELLGTDGLWSAGGVDTGCQMG